MIEQPLPNVSDEFLVKGKLYTEIKKLGGRYTKNQRHKRRAEVYRLHFELEYSAVKISEMMKINRHTISADIQYWNEQLADEWGKIDVYGRCMKQLHSLESQKNRLIAQLQKAKSFSEKISLEKLILQVDDRITKMIIQADKTEEKTRRDALSLLNRWAKNNDINHRFVDQNSLLQVTESQYEKIRQVLGYKSE